MIELRMEQLSVTAADGVTLVAPADLALNSGELVALVGPNGAGKSSLVRALAGIAPYAGSARVDEIEIAGMSAVTRARRIAWLPQSLPPAWPVTVSDAVALGRYAYGAVPGRLAPDDAAAVERALAACDVGGLANRRITTLSGGELARVHLARALAAEADVLLADEPTAALDLAHRWDLMRLLRAEATDGKMVLVVVHDISLAVRWAERIIVMDGGCIVADGAPLEIIAPQLLADVFGVIADVSVRNGALSVDVIGTP